MKKGVKNSLIGSSIAVAGAGAIAASVYTVTKRLLTMAMDRNEPVIVVKKREKIMGGERLADFANELKKNALKLEKYETKLVEIEADDSVKLVGHWRTCENPKRVIIAMHGWRSSWSSDFGCVADFWHENNCNVLFAEQRAQNNSEGEYMGFGLLERYDCLQWIKWVNETTGGKLPIYLCGVSMGATTVLMASGLELPENVRGVVADSGFTSPHAIWKHVMNKNLHMSYGLHGAIANDMCKKRINMGTKDYSTLVAMEQCKVPILFVHGTEDHFVPVEMTYDNYKACSAPKRLLIVPGADHCMNYFMNKETYEKAIKDFWQEHDK